jgi:hypothetical protein
MGVLITRWWWMMFEVLIHRWVTYSSLTTATIHITAHWPSFIIPMGILLKAGSTHGRFGTTGSLER